MKRIAQIVCGFIALVVAAPAFAGSSCPGPSQEWIYWVEGQGDTVKRAHLDGTCIEIVYSSLDGVESPGGVALAPAAGELYWMSFTNGIQRGNLDGTAAMVTILPWESAQRIVVNPDAGTMYWIMISSTIATIFKANLDGSDLVEIPLEGPAATALAIDVEGGKLYWALKPSLTCALPSKIQRSNLDGSGIEDVMTGLQSVQSLAVDHGLGKIYWSADAACGGVSSIYRADLDGKGAETLISGEFALGIALNPREGKMYWTRITGSPDVIRWANLDGTGAATLIGIGLQLPISMAILLDEHNPADLNDDGVVNGIDLAILLGAWGRCPSKGPCDADLNGNGVVNGIDLAMLLGAWTS